MLARTRDGDAFLRERVAIPDRDRLVDDELDGSAFATVRSLVALVESKLAA